MKIFIQQIRNRMDGEANGKDDDHDDMDEVGHGKALGCWFVRGLFSFCFSFYTVGHGKALGCR